MKKRLPIYWHTCFLILFIAFTAPVNTLAQSIGFGREKTGFEVGINIGPSFFLGDLGGNRGVGTRFIKDVNLPLTNIMKGVFVAVYPNQFVAVRLAAQMGSLEADDNIIKMNGGAELWRKQRNLDFRTKISEAYVALEVYPFSILNDGNDDYAPRFKPYAVLGVGVFKFNPQGSLTDNNGVKTWHDLKPLHIEGQGFPEYPDRPEYSLTQVNIPMGLGIKYYITERINVSFEILLRKSFTDYIDDVSTTYIDPNLYDKYLSAADAAIARKISDKMYGIVSPGLSRYSPGTQRGNKNQNDSYFTTFVKCGVRLGSLYENSRPLHLKTNFRCPKL